MRKLLLLFLSVIFLPGILISQETEQKHNLNFSGYIGYEMYFDTYNSATTRDGQVYLYPFAEDLDINGDDINQNFQSQMLSIQSRTRLTSSGLSAFGADGHDQLFPQSSQPYMHFKIVLASNTRF